MMRRLPFLRHAWWGVVLLCAGCATVPLDSARREFNQSRLDQADRSLADLPSDRNRILYLMERGMIRHLRQDYTGSTLDWLEAVRLEDALETHSISKAGASMVVNDTLLDFRGYPYERMLLHAYLARNYLAQGLWDEAAVEGRRMARMLENPDGFPEVAYGRYLAAFCFEMIGDSSSAAMQYRVTAARAPAARLDPESGRFRMTEATNTAPEAVPFLGTELVCFVDFDGAYGLVPDYAEVRAGGRLIGVSRTLDDVARLELASAQRMAARRGLKTASRLALKYGVATAASQQNGDLGQLLWMLLLAAEQPDERRWETLPAKLAVVRAPCPENLSEFEVTFRSASGTPLRTITVKKPITRNGRVFVSFCRDHPRPD